MSTACPKCGSRYLRPAHARSFSEEIGKLWFRAPLRCLDCNKRFVAQTFVLADLFFARCPICFRMDLNGWTGKTFTDPPFWVGLKVKFGAYKWRCEYCRLNFASFRRRKEVFTFRRWAKFGPGAEASLSSLQAAVAPQTGTGLESPGTEAPPSVEGSPNAERVSAVGGALESRSGQGA